MTTDAVQIFLRRQTLVVNLRDAVHPVLWQADLATIKSAMLDVVPMGGQVQIRYRSHDGTVQDVAVYQDAARAHDVLQQINDILYGSGPKQKIRREQLWLAGAAVLLLIMLSAYLFSMVSPPTRLDTGSPPPPSAPATAGVPMDADDILGPATGGTP